MSQFHVLLDNGSTKNFDDLFDAFDEGRRDERVIAIVRDADDVTIAVYARSEPPIRTHRKRHKL